MADETPNDDLNGRIALITGANKGIGQEIARQLARRGATVLVGARDSSRGEETVAEIRASGGNAEAIAIDVTAAASIAAASAAIEARHGRLDILINNAGIARDNAPASEVAIDILRETYETNVFGVLAVTQAMLPLLRKSDAGRIVNQSSGLGSLTQNSDPNFEYAHVKPAAYNSSKAAVNMLTIVLAAELRDTPIKVNSADPGFTATDLNQHRGTRTVAQGATIAVRLATLSADGPTGGFFDEEGEVPW